MRLRKAVRIEGAGDDSLVVTGGSKPLDLRFSHPEVLAAVRSLSSYEEFSEGDAKVQLSDPENPGRFAEFIFSIGLLHGAEALEYWIDTNVVVVPNSSHWLKESPAPEQHVELSRFATFRFAGSIAIVQSPLAHASLHLHSKEAILELGNLALASSHPRLSAAVKLAGLSSDADRLVRNWSGADLDMHQQNRISGARASGAEKQEALNGHFQPDVSEWLPLPDVTKSSSSMTLDKTLRSRRSRRIYAPEAIAIEQLSELLARSSWEGTQTFPNKTQGLARAYPSGGNLHSLDLYVAVAHCAGVGPALYLYDRRQHLLGRVAGPEVSRSLVREARRAAFEDDEGQVLIILAADFEAVTTRYKRIAYSLILKEVGAALQTIHLVATELNLAACPIGTGDSALFSRALGSNPFQYTSVGELLIGTSR